MDDEDERVPTIQTDSSSAAESPAAATSGDVASDSSTMGDYASSTEGSDDSSRGYDFAPDQDDLSQYRSEMDNGFFSDTSSFAAEYKKHRNDLSASRKEALRQPRHP